MGRNPREQKDIDELRVSVKTIETALIGNLETKEPGMIDDLHDTQKDVGYIKTKLRENKKQHFILFGLVGILMVGAVSIALGADPAKAAEWVVNVITGRL